MGHYIAFFDLDKTITGAVSGTEIAREARRRGIMTAKDLIRALWLSLLHKLSLREPGKIVNEMAGWVKGIPVNKLQEISCYINNDILIPALYNDALSEIEKHRKAGAKIVLLSSTTSIIGKDISGHLNLDDYICSEFEAIDEILTGKTVRPLCFGEEKAVRMKEYCEKNNTKLQSCWYYGDSMADKFALETCGHPVCVNPDRFLKKLATINKWEIVSWK